MIHATEPTFCFDDAAALPELKQDFPALSRRIDGRRLVYLDNAATTLKPQAVIDAVCDYYLHYSANIHRGKHRLSEEASDRYEEARCRIAAFLRCRSDEIVFVRNATEAINLVARGLVLQKSDLIVGCLDSHHAQMLPWREAGRLELTRSLPDGTVDLEHFADLLDRRPSVVALTHCSNVSGAYLPLRQMADMAKAAGALVVVDAAQSMPHRRVDVSGLAADFVAFSGHKMLGPSGIGVLYGRHDLLERLAPLNFGGGTVDWVDHSGSRLRKLPHRLEAGTPAIEAAIGLGAAVDYLDLLGEEAVAEHDRLLASALLEQVSRRPHLRLLGPRDPERRAALVSLAVPGLADTAEVVRMLSDGYGVMVRGGHLCAQPYVDAQTELEAIRLSAYLYNDAQDIEHAFHALDQVLHRFSITA